MQMIRERTPMTTEVRMIDTRMPFFARSILRLPRFWAMKVLLAMEKDTTNI